LIRGAERMSKKEMVDKVLLFVEWCGPIFMAFLIVGAICCCCYALLEMIDN